MPSVFVNGQEIELKPEDRLNGIQAAARAGVEIPHYCWHPGLSVVASCRMCLVEVGKRDAQTGKVAMQPRLVPACQTPAAPDTVFITNSDKVKNARAMVEEDLLIRHPIDCPICDKAGECSLQDYHFEYGRDQRRADVLPFTSRRRDLGDTVTLFVDRCVMCTRCVRFAREITGTSELMVINRGAHEEIDVFRDEHGEIALPLANKLSGNVCDLCPVGALGDKDFLYQQRVWFMQSHEHVCANCSTGCSIKVEENQDRIYRLKPRENPHVNQWWMCDEGRYGFKHVHDPGRLVTPHVREGEARRPIEWHAVEAELTPRLKAAGRLAAVLSPHLTVEEAYLLATYLRGLDPQATLAVGPIPTAGADERFPNGFVIHAEKCPNRRGVEAIAARQKDGLVRWEDFLPRVAAGEFGGVWVSGGYKSDWNDAATAEAFAPVQALVVQDCFASPLWEAATVGLPGSAFAEREGSYVNYQNRLQSFRWAVRPPAGVQTEGQLLWRLLRRPGLYSGRKTLEELAREIAWFAPAAGGVPAVGLDLQANQLAAQPEPALAQPAGKTIEEGEGTMLEALVKIGLLLGGVMTAAAYFVLLERKMAAWTQDRIGPNRVGIPLTKIGLFGLGQPLADGVKFILKEEYTPAHVDRRLFVLAPIVLLVAALTAFAVIPFGSLIPPFAVGPLASEQPVELVVAPGVDVGMLFVFALSSIAVYGVILGGWASNNKYSFLGGLRSSAQLIAYELPLGLGILGVVLAAGSLNLEEIMRQQASGAWHVFFQPLGFLVFLVAAFAESSRLPFDLPESEQELIGGYHTEYSGIKLLLFLVGEFLHMIAAAYLIVILFFGGWSLGPLTGAADAPVTWVTALLRIAALQGKVFLVILFFMWVRWSWPRFRFDQLMALGWKVMLPLGLINLVAVAISYELRRMYDPAGASSLWFAVVALVGWGVCAAAWLGVSLAGAVVTDNRPQRDLRPLDVDSQV